MFGREGLAAHEREFELVVLFDQAGAGDDVGVLDGVHDLLHGDAVRGEAFGVNRRLVLAHLPARDGDGRHAREAREAGPHDVVGDVAQGGRVARV